MTGKTYPRNLVESTLINVVLQPIFRIVPAGCLLNPLGLGMRDSRFCTEFGAFAALYGSPTFSTALLETVIRDFFVRSAQRIITLEELSGRGWPLIATKPGIDLTLLDLRQGGCVRLGAPTDAVNARNQAASRALARSIYFGHEDVDGIVFPSRLNGGDVYVIFDRAIDKLEAIEIGMLLSRVDLESTLGEYGFRVEV